MIFLGCKELERKRRSEDSREVNQRDSTRNGEKCR